MMNLSHFLPASEIDLLISRMKNLRKSKSSLKEIQDILCDRLSSQMAVVIEQEFRNVKLEPPERESILLDIIRQIQYN